MDEAQPAAGRAQVTTEVTARHFRVASPATATVLGGLVLALVVACALLTYLTSDLQPSADLAAAAISVVFGAVGVVVARHLPRNPIGWILVGCGLWLIVFTDASLYSVLDYRIHGGGLPLGLVAVLLDNAWLPALMGVPLAILLFPDGRLMASRWRWALWAYIALGPVLMAGAFAGQAGAVIGRPIHVAPDGQLVSSNSGGSAFVNALFLLLALIWLAWVVRQVISYRRSSGERRQQLKWLMSGGAACVVAVVACSLIGTPTTPAAKVISAVLVLAFAALPASIGVGILKYGLYEIDRIISRTLAYAIVTGLLVGVYAGLVLLATQVLAVTSPVAVAASTLAAAALFSPLRRRVQKAVDRRFNRARYDADRTAAAFAARLKDEVDLDAVKVDLAGLVHQALEPAHVSVWINERR